MAANLSSQDGDIGFQIAPMVDVVFVLLLFFMACAGAMLQERELSVNLPSHGGGPTAIVVVIGADGAVTLNDLPIGTPTDTELRDLRGWFRAARAKFGTDDAVVIRPDATVRHERLMNVLNALSAIGVKKLSFG